MSSAPTAGRPLQPHTFRAFRNAQGPDRTTSQVPQSSKSSERTSFAPYDGIEHRGAVLKSFTLVDCHRMARQGCKWRRLVYAGGAPEVVTIQAIGRMPCDARLEGALPFYQLESGLSRPFT